VKEALENGKIERVHYETYLGILNELKNRKERY
jgi:putative ribosome biogenesis GTPase RsgA